MDKELCAALVAVQSKFRGIIKEGRNPAFNSRYMTLDTILDTLRPLLVENGLVVTQDVTESQYNAEGRLMRIQLATTVHHVNGGTFSVSIPIPVTKPDAQGVGGCLTYGRRYSLCALLMISADDDLDGNDAVAQKTYAPPVNRPIQKLPRVSETEEGR
jgi:hypothetical protein